MRYLHTMVRVTDLDASLRFYCDLLGLEETRRIENEAEIRADDSKRRIKAIEKDRAEGN